MNKESMGSVCFSISGAYITDVARQLVEEGKWRNALNLLVEGLQGFTIDDAVKVLKGSARLEGVNSVDLVEDDQEAVMKEMLDDQFSGMYLHEGSLYEAVSYHRYSNYPGFWQTLSSSLKSMYLPTTEQLEFEFNSEHGTKITDPIYIRYEKSSRDVPFWYPIPKEPVLPKDYQYLDHTDFFEADRIVQDWSDSRVSVATEVVKQQAELVAEQQEETRREAARQAELKKIFDQIAEEADNDTEYGWALVPFKDTTLRVPKRALIALVMNRASRAIPGLNYTAKSYVGMKLQNDNPLHTDVVIGSGLDPLEIYSLGKHHEQEQAIMEYGWELQESLTGWTFNVITRGDSSCNHVYGKVITEDRLHLLASKDEDDDYILVVKNAAPEWATYLSKVNAVIVEQGSQLAHLAVVARERQVPVLRLAQATDRFLSGCLLSINFKTGIIS